MRSLPASAAARPEPAAGLPIRLRCSGCGYQVPPDAPVPLSCPRARPGDDIDHVLARSIDAARLGFPTAGDPNPFVRFRTLLYGYHVARAAGRTDADVVELIRHLDGRVAAVDERGFRATPFGASDRLARELGPAGSGRIWVKDETGNVSGSHKARHLFGTLLEARLAGAAAGDPLAIASCGNAALAAAVLARAAERPLTVYIPPHARPAIVARLRHLGAQVVTCRRDPNESGDPTYRRLLEAVANGATPFTCQGNLNGLAIEGGMTLGWELADGLLAAGADLDHLVIQVGGGALASAVIQALGEAHTLGALQRMPRIHTVQTRGAFPLARAHDLLAAELGHRRGTAEVGRALAAAARRRSAYMWPWETEPHSIAEGILDDETYDWLAVVRGMLLSGGLPVVVDDHALAAANELARRATGIDVDPTGSAGLAGAMELIRRGEIGPDESTAVIFTGVRRHATANGGQS